ncbi:hypothetical protein [Acinetobacter zhairhuonensis]|uniref:hypothetical protein n=1 Tax=Acinetobacter sp. A7.4 TaxID=2919921 RepID=UPI001F4F4AEB|nr:hypothetical protein [Acinetobacter sp. A7.4]MCJ8162002.1 hypothetical protein [Acinetobacter sp. A7.4]
MSFEESLYFFINYILISPFLCYLAFGIQLLFKRYSTNISSNQLLEQEKLLKEFKTKFSKSTLNLNLQGRELYAQNIAKLPNISGRFIAYCLKREIHNINYVMYLFNYTGNLVKVPDIEGNNYLQILEQKNNVLKRGIFFPFLLSLVSVLIVFFYPASSNNHILIIYLAFFLFSTWLLLTSFPYLCIYLLEKNTECIFYEKHSVLVKGSSNLPQDVKGHENLCYLIERAKSRFGFLHMSAQKILKELEIKQMSHDDRYHKDVWVLSTQSKAKHMAAHIGKYSGQILEVMRNPDIDNVKIQKYVIDSLIINFSYANIFVHRLSKHLDQKYLVLSSLKELRNEIAKDYLNRKSYTNEKASHGLDLAMDMCILASKILKTVESLDHVEKHDFRQNFNKYVLDIFEILITFCFIYDIEGIENLIADRMHEVEERHEYFEEFGNYKDGYKVI